MKVLLDTCVVIDLLQKRMPFFEDAHTLFLAVANQQFEGYLSAKSITDIYYLMHRCLHDDKATRKALETLLKLLSILDTTDMDCRNALLSPVSDYEDALMIETAARTAMDCIVTRNIKDYANAKIKVYTPEQFLTVLRQSFDA